MTQVHERSEIPYVFWLFAWGVLPISPNFRVGPHYSRCEITVEEFVIYDDKDKSVFSVLIKDIRKCELFDKRWTGSASSVNFRIEFIHSEALKRRQTQVDEVYLSPANVFKHRTDVSEMKAMLTIIESFRNGDPILIKKNPYHRQLIRQEQPERIVEREWNPNLPPSHYSTAPSLKRFLMIAPLIFIAIMIVVLFLSGFIYYLVTDVF